MQFVKACVNAYTNSNLFRSRAVFWVGVSSCVLGRCLGSFVGVDVFGGRNVFSKYQHQGFFDEIFFPNGQVRPHYQAVLERLSHIGVDEFEQRVALSELAFRNQGITFTVYGDAQGTERTLPFDPTPRLIPSSEWAVVEAGLRQRVLALNMFLHDIYHDAEIIGAGIIPADLVYSSLNYRREMRGITLPYQRYTHVVGTDLVRGENGRYAVLEDNLRVPSGVSYMLANRAAMTRIFPKLFRSYGVRPVQQYSSLLLNLLRSLAPGQKPDPTIVVLTPGMYNSAYFEHSFLAQQMGVELVEGRDLFVDEGRVWMRTSAGRQQVDVIYRRLDDDFLDPIAFRPDSALGVRGLMQVYRAGRVALANAVGTGVADDKAVYAYVPQMIRYYLNEEAILDNIPTFLGLEPEGLAHMLEHSEELVFKPVNESGGYGLMIGPHTPLAERMAYLERVKANPRNYIAQPVVGISRHPSYYRDTKCFEPCHIDLRPYILVGEEVKIVPGGLTRVALKRGSLVVNSSQGGGSKDTWVLEGDLPRAPVGAVDSSMESTLESTLESSVEQLTQQQKQ